MVLYTLALAACGAILGFRLKAFVLLPASFSAWGLALLVAWAKGLPPWGSFVTMVLFATCLQLGYLMGATYVSMKEALRNRGRVVAMH